MKVRMILPALTEATGLTGDVGFHHPGEARREYAAGAGDDTQRIWPAPGKSAGIWRFCIGRLADWKIGRVADS
jgi:hypothetical protein